MTTWEDCDDLLLDSLAQLNAGNARAGWNLRKWRRYYLESPTAGSLRAYRELHRYEHGSLRLVRDALRDGFPAFEVNHLLSRGIPEAGLLNYIEYSRLISDADPDEKWAIIRGLHHTPISELIIARNLADVRDRTKAMCRSLIAVLLAVYEGVPAGDRASVVSRSRTLPDEEMSPAIVHEGILALIQSHPEGGDTIATFVRKRGLGGLEAARTALEDRIPSAIGDGAL